MSTRIITEKAEQAKPNGLSHKIRRLRGYNAVPIIIRSLWELIRSGHRDHTSAEWARLCGIGRRNLFYALRKIRQMDTGLSITVLSRKGLRVERNLDALFRVHPLRAYPYAPQKEYRKASRIENKRPFEGQKPHLEMPKQFYRHWIGRLKRLIRDWSATPIFADWGVDLYKCIGVIVWRWRWSQERLLKLERGISRTLRDFPNSMPRGLRRNRASTQARWGYAFKCLQIFEGLGE